MSWSIGDRERERHLSGELGDGSWSAVKFVLCSCPLYPTCIDTSPSDIGLYPWLCTLTDMGLHFEFRSECLFGTSCHFLFKYFQSHSWDVHNVQMANERPINEIDRMFIPSPMFGDSCPYRIHLILGLQVDPRWNQLLLNFICLRSSTHVILPICLSVFEVSTTYDTLLRPYWLSSNLVIQVSFKELSHAWPSSPGPPQCRLSADSDMWIPCLQAILNRAISWWNWRSEVILWPLFLIYPYLSPLTTFWRTSLRHMARRAGNT